MLQRAISCTLCGILCATLAVAQDAYIMTEDSADFCIPSVEGLSRPKGLVISQEIISGHRVATRGLRPIKSNDVGEINTTRRREIKLKAPLLNRDGLKMAIGFKYRVVDTFFDDIELERNPFYQNLQDKNLKQIGTSIYVVKPFKGNVYLLVRASASLNGDYDRASEATKDYLKYSIAPLIGWKKSDKLSYAVGIGYSENFGRMSVFPLFSYNQTFSERFGLETLLPLRFKLRYSTLNKQNYLYLASEIHGSTYNVTFRDGDTGYLNNTELKNFITYEREIYDFVWFSIEAGLRSNLDFSLSETPNRRISTVIDNNLSQSFYYGFSVFLVPPKKMMKKR